MFEKVLWCRCNIFHTQNAQNSIRPFTNNSLNSLQGLKLAVICAYLMGQLQKSNTPCDSFFFLVVKFWILSSFDSYPPLIVIELKWFCTRSAKASRKKVKTHLCLMQEEMAASSLPTSNRFTWLKRVEISEKVVQSCCFSAVSPTSRNNLLPLQSRKGRQLAVRRLQNLTASTRQRRAAYKRDAGFYLFICNLSVYTSMQSASVKGIWRAFGMASAKPVLWLDEPLSITFNGTYITTL